MGGEAWIPGIYAVFLHSRPFHLEPSLSGQPFPPALSFLQVAMADVLARRKSRAQVWRRAAGGSRSEGPPRGARGQSTPRHFCWTTADVVPHWGVPKVSPTAREGKVHRATFTGRQRTSYRTGRRGVDSGIYGYRLMGRSESSPRGARGQSAPRHFCWTTADVIPHWGVPKVSPAAHGAQQTKQPRAKCAPDVPI